jgi:hypothetical protein
MIKFTRKEAAMNAWQYLVILTAVRLVIPFGLLLLIGEGLRLLHQTGANTH